MLLRGRSEVCPKQQLKLRERAYEIELGELTKWGESGSENR